MASDFIVHHDVVTAPGASPDRLMLVLHGILGSGANWRTFARRLAAAHPSWGFVLVDLRAHGQSTAAPPPHTLTAAAEDLVRLGGALDRPVRGALGHSFGGKVALEVAARTGTRPMQVWLVDSTPEAQPPSGSAWRMLESVRSLPARFADREEAVAALGAGGWSPHIAQWMASNLVRRGSAFEWQLDFDVMETLLRDFFGADLWPVVEDRSLPHVFHLIKATDSRVVSDEALERLRAIGPPRVVVHELEGSHWIHAEKPAEVVELLARELPAGR